MAFYGPPPTGGFNPRWGRDEGAQPPHGAVAGGMPFIPAPQMPSMYSMPQGYGMMPHQPHMMSQPANPFFVPQPAPGIPYQQPSQNGYTYISGIGGGNRHAQPHPLVNPDLPAANMTNSTGGVGCEPGYNYFFGPEHTKVHIIKSGATPPWELPRNFSVPFHACHVPTSTTVGDLLRGFGATNPIRKKNKVWEVVQGGNGKWYKGLSFNGDQDDEMGKTMKELGWDSSRSGLPGRKPVVYLYITKD